MTKNFLETELNYHFSFSFTKRKVAKKSEKRITLPLRYNLGIAEKLNFLKNVWEAAARPCAWLSYTFGLCPNRRKAVNFGVF